MDIIVGKVLVLYKCYFRNLYRTLCCHVIYFQSTRPEALEPRFYFCVAVFISSVFIILSYFACNCRDRKWEPEDVEQGLVWRLMVVIFVIVDKCTEFCKDGSLSGRHPLDWLKGKFLVLLLFTMYKNVLGLRNIADTRAMSVS